MLGFNELGVSAQESDFIIVLNPGATDSNSQNPIAPANVTVPAGTNVTWINKDSSSHMLVSGTPDEGPNNIFYGDYFSADENYTVTFEQPGLYPYYDPVWNHIRGVVTVDNPVFYGDLGSSMNTSRVDSSINDNLLQDSNASADVINSDENSLNTSWNDSFSFPSSSFLSSFPSSTTQSASPDHVLTNIFNKVGPMLSLLMNGDNSSSPPLSSFSQSNESFGVNDFDNQSSFPSSTTQSASPDHVLTNIFNKVGPMLSLLMNGDNSSSPPLSSFSQSNGMFGEGLTDTADFSNNDSEDKLLSDDTSNFPLNDTFTLQNKSITSLGE